MVLAKLLENTSPIASCATTPQSMMTLSMEHFHCTTHETHIDESAQYTRQFMRRVKESLKISHPWSAYYFRNRKGSWYPLTESCIDYRELSLVLRKKSSYLSKKVYLSSSSTNIKAWINSVWPLRKCPKTRTLPHYLYYNKISRVVATTETYSADMVRSSDVEKKVPYRIELLPKVESTSEEQYINLTLQVKRRRICFQRRPVMLPA